MNNTITLSIVIVSYNTSQYLYKCLESIFQHTKGITFEVIVIDNSSVDGSVEMVRKNFPNIILYPMPENLGFGRGNNIGIHAAKGKFTLLLNPDTIILDNSFPKIIKFLENTSDIVGATRRLVQDDGRWIPSAFKYPTIFSKWFFYSFALLIPLPLFDRIPNYKLDRLIEADWIVGAAMMIWSKPLKNIGGFDEKIFMFSEDIDLCIRLKQSSGDKLYYFPDATIIHVGQVSHRGKLFSLQCGFRSTCYYFYKYFGMRKAQIFKVSTRFSWAVILFALELLNIATLYRIPKLKNKVKIYFAILNTKADCLSGMT